MNPQPTPKPIDPVASTRAPGAAGCDTTIETTASSNSDVNSTVPGETTLPAIRRTLGELQELLADGTLPTGCRKLRVLIGQIETTTAALAGLQMQAIVAFDAATRKANAAKGLPPKNRAAALHGRSLLPRAPHHTAGRGY